MKAIAVIVFLLFLVGILVLHVLLSRRQNKWLGLIIPVMNFMISIVLAMGIPSYNIISKQEVKTIDSQGVVVSEIIKTDENTKPMTVVSSVITAVMVFIMYNISTVILLAIYVVCRPKPNKRNELEKMNIQDLE